MGASLLSAGVVSVGGSTAGRASMNSSTVRPLTVIFQPPFSARRDLSKDVESGGAVGRQRRTDFERRPHCGGKPFIGGHLASEQPRQLLVPSREHVDAHYLVACHVRIGGGDAVMQTRSVGRSSVTLQIVDAVKPARSAPPSVVTS